MEHHGKRLHALIKSKGFNLQEVADRIPKTRVSVERDVKSEILTRKVINRYASVLSFDVDDFFRGEELPVSKGDKDTELKLLRELVQEQRKRLDLQDLMIRFFPKAA